MSFLAPLFLIGGLAVGLPILFHLIRRTIQEKQTFSSLMFLLPTPPRVTRHSRLENLLLLALRCLVLCLLALAFSRPFFQSTAPTDPSLSGSRQTTILIDVSASMRREDLWAQAVKAAEREIEASALTDLVGLYAFDQNLIPVVSVDQIKSLPVNDRKPRLRATLAALKPGWGSANLGRALIAASENMEGSGHGAGTLEGVRQILVVSDLAEGTRLDGLQGHEWPPGLNVRLEAVKPQKITNAGLHLLPERPEDEDVKGGTVVRVRVSNASDSKREQFRLRWEGAGTNAGPVDVYVPPGQNRVVTTTLAKSTGMRASLEGDDANFDNVLSWVPPVAENIRVLYVGGDAPSDPNQPGYYIHRALISSRSRVFEVVTQKPEELGPAVSGSAEQAWAMLVCASSLSEAQGKALREKVAAGRTLLYSVPTPSAAAGLAALLSVGEVRIQEAPKRNFSLLAQVDFQSALFAPFADARFGDFTKIHFWKHRQLDRTTLPKEAKVLAAFDDESPAVIEVPAGKGSIVILSAGWNPSDSQLALSTKFIPLLFSLIERSHPERIAPGLYGVGDRISLQEVSTNRSSSLVGLTVRKPDGTEVKVAVGGRFEGADQPGLYQVVETGSQFAVNLAAEESRTSPLSLDHFEKLALPLLKPLTDQEKAQTQEKARILAATELENRQKLWQWLIVAGLAFVLGETWLSGRMSRPVAVAAS